MIVSNNFSNTNLSSKAYSSAQSKAPSFGSMLVSLEGPSPYIKITPKTLADSFVALVKDSPNVVGKLGTSYDVRYDSTCVDNLTKCVKKRHACTDFENRNCFKQILNSLTEPLKNKKPFSTEEVGKIQTLLEKGKTHFKGGELIIKLH